MASFYQPQYISKYETGLVQSREEFLLPPDAFPVLENAFIWRERVKRKSGYNLLGRLRRILESHALGNLDGAGAFSGNIKAILSLEANSDINPGTLEITDGVNTWTDDGLGNMQIAAVNSGTINYSTMALTLSGGVATNAITADFEYFPSLPVMGIRSREINNINFEQTVVFDTVYAYRYLGGWQEFIPGTTWTGTNSDFFYSTNYWVGTGNQKIFWVTNFSGTSGDPIRYTNATAWADFTPTIDAGGNQLFQCLAILPFRGRLMVFNTFEGAALGTSVQFKQRIRWAQIGNPFYEANAIVTDFNVDAWRDDIPGRGGFLDIPTSEDITAVGFVRDNLVIFCERSTWQLRYTGRSIAPFQIEKVNTELGAESTFSAVQFDTSLVGIGDKGIVECDSYKSDRIDIKIPDLVFRFSNDNNGVKRVHGIRDFQQRVAYWTYPDSSTANIFPDRRLVYNYENDSWAIFKDSFTALGYFQSTESKKWSDFPGPDDTDQWQNQNYPWINKPAQFPAIIGGNQQGYIEVLGQYDFEFTSTNDVSLSIKGITGNVTTPTSINSPSHNLVDNEIIKIYGIPEGTPFARSLNGNVFRVDVADSSNFLLYKYDTETLAFTDPQLDANDTYIGGGQIAIRDNFRIQSKKFNFLDQGQTIQLGFMDILMENTENGAVTMNVYTDYNVTQPQNTISQNLIEGVPNTPDTFFNSVIPTNAEIYLNSSKNWQRIYCNTRGSFITLEFTLSNAQMNGNEQEEDVQIDGQIIYFRPAGKQLTARSN